ncbi:MAG: DUF998 domain-containing protein [Candidatus Dojkabacteria bacterium]
MEKIVNIKAGNFYTIGIALSIIAIVFSFLRIGEIYEVISEFGADTRTALIYNILIFFSGIFITLGSVFLCRKHFKVFGVIPSILLLATSTSLIFLGLFPLGISQQIRVVHWTFAAIFFFGFAICMVAFALIFRRIRSNIALILLIFGIADVLQLLLLYPNQMKLISQTISIILSIAFLYILVIFSPQLPQISSEY